MKAQPRVPRKILRLGALQSGKTTGSVTESVKESNKDSNLVNIFIAHKTNVNKDNQEKHIENLYGGKVELLNTSREIATYTAFLEKRKNMFSSNYPVCISCLDHHTQLEAVLTLTGLRTPKQFDTYIDESDAMALFHDRKGSDVRKDNIVNSLIQHETIRHFSCLTATPFTEIASKLYWDDIVIVEPGANYKGPDDCKVTKITEAAMKDFNRGIISYSLEEIFKEEAKLFNTVTLVATKRSNPLHYIQAELISALVGEKCLVAVLNSGTKQKYYVNGKTHYVPTKRNGEGQLEELFEVAKDYNKLFVVGHDMIGRSVTLKSDKFQEISSIIFSCSDDTCLATMLQRIGRVCGYQKNAGTIFTDKDKLLQQGLMQYPEMLKLAAQYKDPNERMKALFHSVPIYFPRVFGQKNNDVKVKSSSRTASERGVEAAKAIQLGFNVLSELKVIESKKIPPKVLESLEAGEKAVQGSDTYNYILNQDYRSKRILKAENKFTNMALPNAAIEDNYRDTLYYYEGNTLRIVVQPNRDIRLDVPFAVHNIFTGKVDCYSPKGKFRR